MNQNFEDLREIVTDIISRRNRSISEGIQNDFLKTVFGIRFFTVMNKDQISTIWNAIRINEQLTDFIIDCSREFLLRAFSSDYTYDTLVKDITNTYTLLATNLSSIDEDLLSTIATNKTIEEIFHSNPWFTFLYICEGLIELESKDEKA